MVVKRVKLIDFRNYQESEFPLGEGINVVVGHNAVGKTNLLEALYLLSVGESFRAKKIEEMVRFGSEVGRVQAELVEEDEEKGLELEAVVTSGLVEGKRVAKRKLLVDGASKLRKDFVGILSAVLFRPEDMELVEGSPTVRREALNQALLKVDGEYARSLMTYEQALKRRNRLLDAIREGTATRYSLTFWNGLLIKHGQELENKRDGLIRFMNDLWARSDLFNHLRIVYERSGINEDRLEQYKDEEIEAGHTLVGPHKDDFQVVDGEGRELAVYGSRGEQRMAVLAIKMGEIYFLEAKKKEKPLLLLDDIFSELDMVHRQEVLRVMQGRQVVVTTAVEEDVKKFEQARVIRLI